MEREVIPVALIGCGKIARKHVQVLRAIPNLKLSAVVDADPKRAAAIAAEVEGARVLPDLEAVCSDPEIRLGVVCTPSGLHARQGMQLARAGKHVVVEKPMALRLDEADRLIEACDRAGVKLFVVKQNRYNAPVRKAREAIESGRMGRIFLGDVRVLWNRSQAYYDEEPWRGTWEMDGGVLTNQASHHIDLLIWMMGDVESVYAQGRTVMHQIEVEDLGAVLLKFRSGGLGIVEASTSVQPKDLEGSLNLYGEGGTIEIGGFAANELKTWRFREETPEDEEIRRDHARNPAGATFAHHQFYLNVVEALHDQRRALIDGIQGRRSLEVIHAIYESMETGQEVQLRFEARRCRLGAPLTQE
ncbi:MAG: Gfo/Idh/MocA family oxidoreductase [Candidatus Eisenbacteria bacterium]|nr:Gfo/Idh/MocA family oxidoreductase [Candidatus Eisenbacteria bacterium]MCC7143062.1 Gfo/Idh/MocA family oxidoreductase [Candidatus Eisenbacteria bacterium]